MSLHDDNFEKTSPEGGIIHDVKAEEIMDQADDLYWKGKWKEAYDLYEIVLRIEPSWGRAKEYFEKAKYNYDNNVSIPRYAIPESLRINFSRAESALSRWELDSAKNFFEQAKKDSIILGIEWDELEALNTKIDEYLGIDASFQRALVLPENQIQEAIDTITEAYELTRRPKYGKKLDDLKNLQKSIKENRPLQEQYYEWMGRGRHALDIEDYEFAIIAFKTAQKIIEGNPDIVSTKENVETKTFNHKAEALKSELSKFEKGLIKSKKLLQDGDSCTAVEVLIVLTEQSPDGKKAQELYEEAKKIQKTSVILCAEKLAERGGYTRARTILEPVENDAKAQKSLQKIIDRQNQEMAEKARQKKELMNDLKIQSQVWFKLGVAASIIAAVLLIGGAVGAFTGKISAGVLSAVSAIIPSSVAGLFYNQSDKLRVERSNSLMKTLEEENLDIEAQRKMLGLKSTEISEKSNEEQDFNQ